MSATEFTYDELYNIATEADITGRGDMTKDELTEALQEEAPHLLDPFAAVTEIEVGDEVSMNHLSSNLTVTEVRTYTDDEVHQALPDGEEEVTELPDDRDVSDHTVVIMETNRGGRHALVAAKTGDAIPAPAKNGADPHLRRWRAGDEEWMNNSTDPLFIAVIEDDDDSS